MQRPVFTNNIGRYVGMSKVYREETYISEDKKEYNRKQRDELIKDIAKKHADTLKRLSKT